MATRIAPRPCGETVVKSEKYFLLYSIDEDGDRKNFGEYPSFKDAEYAAESIKSWDSFYIEEFEYEVVEVMRKKSIKKTACEWEPVFEKTFNETNGHFTLMVIRNFSNWTRAQAVDEVLKIVLRLSAEGHICDDVRYIGY
jgi:hypothetical protein